MAVESDILEAFKSESYEHLADVEEDVLALERGPVATETVNRLFRSLHTVKGASGFVGLSKVADLSHALENVVGRVRSGGIEPGNAVADALLRGVDKLKLLIEDPENDDIEIAREVDGLASLGSPASRPAGKGTDGDLAQQSASRPERQSPDASVRIPLHLLDKLMNLATELVLIRNQNAQAVESGDRPQLMSTAQRLNVVTSDLQATIMRTRMRPVGNVFGRFTRVVRDLAKALEKEVELDISGADVELDKSIVEAIGDPLTHLLRNAVAHGIEDHAVREAAGKPPQGTIRLRAFHRSGQVNIHVQDDGAGMDPGALRDVAVARGLITRTQSAEMAERDMFKLIFLPGFSTAEEVTDLSGRGVGMDVVKTEFKKLGGMVEVVSRAGEGTTFTIKLPLTLAIVPALVVAVEDLCFAVPQVNIEEVVWLHGEEVHQGLRKVDDQEVYWLRKRLLPVVRLSRVLEIKKTHKCPDSSEHHPERRVQEPDRRQSEANVPAEKRVGPVERRQSRLNSVFILVVRLGEERYGLLVDSILDTEEIVVKSLHEQLKGSGAYAGTTVLGDGRIAMILDVASIAELGALRFVKTDEAAAPLPSSRFERQTLLLFDTGGPETFGVPLGLVSRVEEIDPSRIQVATGREYLEYRGQPMPLVRLESALPETEATYRDDRIYVIVPRGCKTIGVLAANILDTAMVDAEFDRGAVSHPEIVASKLIDGRLTLLLDIYRILEKVEPGWFADKGGNGQNAKRVLLAEDSSFFAALIAPYLRAAGLEVVHVLDGQAALERLDTEAFSILVSDIEMPRLNGYELARRVRSDRRHQDMPLVAISALHDQSLDVDSRRAGFDRFVSKLNQVHLLETLESLCAGVTPVRED